MLSVVLIDRIEQLLLCFSVYVLKVDQVESTARALNGPNGLFSSAEYNRTMGSDYPKDALQPVPERTIH